MPNETINLGILMRRATSCNVSKEAIQEYKSRVEDAIYDNMLEFENIAGSHNRKTISENHVIEGLGQYDRKVVKHGERRGIS